MDLIICGGVNICPAGVEAALGQHSSVACAVVVGIPDDDLGKRVHAVVQTTAPVTQADVRGFLADRLSRIHIPTSFEFTPETLRDDAGKARRITLGRVCGQGGWRKYRCECTTASGLMAAAPHPPTLPGV